MATTKVTTKKATQSTEVILGTAAAKLSKGLSELKGVGETIMNLVEKSETLTAEIAQKEERTAALDVEFAEKKRQAEVNLKLEMQANADAAVENILNSQNKIAIDQQEYTGTLNSLKNLKADFDKEVQSKVAAALAGAKEEYEQDKKILEAQHSTEKAQMQAQLNTMQGQIEFLESQVEDWKDALKSEREAGIERAKAGAVGTINVGSSGAGGR